MSGELPEVVARFVADTATFVADVERAVVADEALAKSTEAVDAALAGMQASLTEVTTIAGEAAAAQTSLADAQTAAGDSASIEAEMQATLAEAEKVAADAAMAGVDASIALAKADRTAGEAAVVLGDEQVALATKTKEASSASAGAVVSHGKLNKVLLGVGAAAIYSTVKAASFQSEVQRLYSAAGLTGARMSDVEKQIMGVANATGFAGNEIAKAMYHPVSAGLDLSRSINTVTEAAKLARIHGADLEETTYALSSLMKAYNIQAKDVTKTSGLLNAIVGQGDMRFQDFNQSIKNWTPTGAQMGISIQSMGAALAYLTDRGNSAEVASTRLTMGLSMVTSGSKLANIYLRDLGVTSGKLSIQNKSLQATMLDAGLTTNKIAADLKKPDGIYVALHDLQGAFHKSGLSAEQADQVMSKIFGGGRSDKAILSLMQNLDGVRSKYDDIGKAVNGYGDSWAKTQATTTQQWHQTTSEVKNLAITIGSALLPAVNSALGGISKALKPIADFASHNQGLVKLLLGVVAGIVAATKATKAFMVVMAALNIEMDANPVGAIILAIEALVILVIYAYTHFTWFRNGVQAVGRAVAAAWKTAWHAMEAVVRWFGSTALPWIQARLKVFSDWWRQNGAEVKQVASETWKIISTIVVTAIHIWWDGYLKPTLTVLAAIWKVTWGLVVDILKLAWHLIYNYVSLGVHQVLDIVAIVLDLLTGKWGKAWSDVKKLASDSFHGIVKIITGIASGFGHLLYDAGRNLIQGLINGIRSMAGGAWSSMKDLVSGLKGFLPNSPAKHGPFSGSGDPYLSGAHIASAVGQGVADNAAAPVAAMSAMASGMAATLVTTSAGLTPQQKDVKHLQTLMSSTSKKETRYDKEEANWKKLYEQYHKRYEAHHTSRYAKAQAHALAEMKKYAKLGSQQDALYKQYTKQLDALLHPAQTSVSRLPASMRGRAEYQAAMAAQSSLAAMRNSVYGGWFGGGPSTLGSSHGTVVQTVVNVNVGGSVRSDRDIVSMVQQGLLTGRKTTTLPAGR
ncbi:MAG: phage tail tape measure protein [Actinoallomurus sp.]